MNHKHHLGEYKEHHSREHKEYHSGEHNDHHYFSPHNNFHDRHYMPHINESSNSYRNYYIRDFYENELPLERRYYLDNSLDLQHKKLDEMLFKIYVGGLGVVGLFMLYKILLPEK